MPTIAWKIKDKKTARAILARSGKIIQAGQVWRDNDPRIPEGLILVLGIDHQAKTADVFRINSKRRTTVRLDRFRPGSTGYTFEGIIDHLGVR